MLIYLIGCLLGFGITYTFIIPYKINEVSCLNMYIYGTFCSWLTVALFLFGVFRGIIKKGGRDED